MKELGKGMESHLPQVTQLVNDGEHLESVHVVPEPESLDRLNARNFQGMGPQLSVC